MHKFFLMSLTRYPPFSHSNSNTPYPILISFIPLPFFIFTFQAKLEILASFNIYKNIKNTNGVTKYLPQCCI